MAKISKKVIREDATRPLTFEITEKHVAAASCGNPEACVIAQAITEHCGDMFERIEVGASVTKLYRIDNKVIRYITTDRLKRALIHWDQTGNWMLPPGKYRLNPPTTSRRLENQPPASGKRGDPNNRRKRKKTYNQPTRTVSRCYVAQE